jgi:hypothetical protein
VFRYRHPIEGEIRFERQSNEVRLYCRWPFDFSSDEWIYLSNRFSLDDYTAALDGLQRGDSVRIRGLVAGTLRITKTGAESVELHMMDACQAAPTQFIAVLDVPLDAFRLDGV